MVILSFVLCFTLLSVIGHSQRSRMDSLKTVLKTETVDSNKIDLLLDLSFGHYQFDISLCRSYAEDAMALSQQINDKNRIALSHNCLGIASELEGNTPQALIHWERCLEISRETDFLTGQMKALHNLGIANKERGNIEQSIEFYLAALRIDENRDNIQPTINTMSNIGNLYLSMGDLDLAYVYLKRAIETGEELGVRSELSHPYQRMGEYYVKKKDYRVAISYLNKAFDICNEYAHDIRGATILRLLGESKYHLGNIGEALEHFSDAETQLKKIGEQYIDLYNLYHSWAEVLMQEGNYQQSLDKISIGYDLAKKNEIKTSQLSALLLYAEIYEQTGNYRQALRYNKSASELKDILNLESKEKTVLELQSKYQTERTEIENELLRTNQERTETRLKNKNIILLATILLTSLSALIAYLLYRAYKSKIKYSEKLQKQVAERTRELEESNLQLKQSNKELESFTNIASHDLKTPLNNIIIFSELLEEGFENNDTDQVKKSIGFIKKGGVRMMNLIEDVLEYSKLSKGRRSDTNLLIDLNQLCSELIDSIYSYKEERNARIDIIDRLPIVYGNYSSFFVLFKNLIENAIKYNESTIPKVKIYSKESSGTFSIYFEDNGLGIDETHSDRIFEMFGRLHNYSNYEGTGLGLSICKKIVEDIGGNILVSSPGALGSIFEVRLPISIIRSKKVNLSVDRKDTPSLSNKKSG